MSLNLDESWLRKAPTVEVFDCDVVFAVATPRSVTRSAVSSALRAPVRALFDALDLNPPPSGDLPSAAVIGREDSLVRYYQALVGVLTEHGDPANLSKPFPYFRVQASISSAGAQLTQFSWLDDVPEVVDVLTALMDSPTAQEGLLWDYIDQGWAANLYRQGEATVLAEWNWEDDADIPNCFSFDAGRLASQAAQALDRLTSIHGQLIEALGRDYWSYARPAPLQQPLPPPGFIHQILTSLGILRPKSGPLRL